MCPVRKLKGKIVTINQFVSEGDIHCIMISPATHSSNGHSLLSIQVVRPPGSRGDGEDRDDRDEGDDGNGEHKENDDAAAARAEAERIKARMAASASASLTR